MAATEERKATGTGPITLDDITATGPGTLGGRFLRMYWQPVSRVVDLTAGRAKPIRIMGEDFTLYRGEGGAPHVVAFRCAHRGTQLSTGWVEGDDLRCFYHGWKYDGTGQCVEQPAEPEPFCNRIKIRSYPTKEYLGLIFAYFGDDEAPPIRRFPDYEQPGVLSAGVPEYWPCNFFNRIDNASDGAHVPWTHRESSMRVAAAAGRTYRPRPSLPRIAEETEYGVRNGVLSNSGPTFTAHFHMPNTNQTLSSTRVEGTMQDAATMATHRLFWRLPVDDAHTVSFVVDWLPLTGEAAEAYLGRRKHAEDSQDAPLGEIADGILQGQLSMPEVDHGLSTYKLFFIEDYVAQVGQGTVANRYAERPGNSDRGVLLVRQLWQRELTALAEGRPLKRWHTPAGLMAEAEDKSAVYGQGGAS
jgi:5,5'-dehydrodivanillate O-demethylase oxygenase subunit